MSDRDPQVQAAVDAAARELARRLEPYVPDANRHLLAGDYVGWLMERGWRHIPRPHLPDQPARPAPPNDEWRRARAALEGNRDA